MSLVGDFGVEPQAAVRFVGAFVPGFLALGLFEYATNVDLDDLHFVYLSIALTLLIQGIADGLRNVLGMIWPASSLGAFGTDRAWVTAASTASVVALTVFVAFLAIDLHSTGAVLKVVSEFTASRKDESGFPFEIKLNDAIDSQGSAGGEVYVRAFVDGVGVFQGRVEYYDGNASNGEIALTSVCSFYGNIEDFAAEKMRRRGNSGVVIRASSVSAFQLLIRRQPCPNPKDDAAASESIVDMRTAFREGTAH